MDLFIGAGMTVPYWDFMGSTMVTNNYVRLTPDSQSKRGILWNSVVGNSIFIVLIIVDMMFPVQICFIIILSIIQIVINV